MSIDDITPQQWDEMARKSREEKQMNLPLNSFEEEQPLMNNSRANDDIQYRYNEGNSIAELHDYIDSTYNQHYSKNKFQATEFIIDGGHGEGFCIGNIMKYAQRYGNKDGYNRKDLLKVLHYAIIMLHVHDKEGRQ